MQKKYLWGGNFFLLFTASVRSRKPGPTLVPGVFCLSQLTFEWMIYCQYFNPVTPTGLFFIHQNCLMFSRNKFLGNATSSQIYVSNSWWVSIFPAWSHIELLTNSRLTRMIIYSEFGWKSPVYCIWCCIAVACRIFFKCWSRRLYWPLVTLTFALFSLSSSSTLIAFYSLRGFPGSWFFYGSS